MEHHRLLLLLSDGKPQDDDGYEGVVAVQDLRQAVMEARALGQHPFALTVERQAAAWMPQVFPPGHWALLQQPERLPLLVLQWLRRLLSLALAITRHSKLLRAGDGNRCGAL